jgi:hypothetical protein
MYDAPLSGCFCDWWNSTTFRPRVRSRKMAVFQNLSPFTKAVSLLDPGVILNVTAVRVRRAEMLRCSCLSDPKRHVSSFDIPLET